MKLSELRRCDRCHSPIVRPPVNWFWVVRISGAMVAARSDQVLRLSRSMGGSLELAEQFAPEPDVVVVASDQDPTLQTEILLCAGCYPSDVPLAHLVSERMRATDAPGPGPEAA